MPKINMLVLTDHTNHSAENSLYALVRGLNRLTGFGKIDVATQGRKENAAFFDRFEQTRLCVNPSGDNFSFHPEGMAFKFKPHYTYLRDYDVVWLRLPPGNPDFLQFLISEFADVFFVNHPSGILETGSKAFLLHFQDICPPMKICRSIDDIVEFNKDFSIVLKPLRSFGGKGIVLVKDGVVFEGNEKMALSEFERRLKDRGHFEYLGVKFLRNVSLGDKRIVVINGQPLGASLRLPPTDSWICNVSLGGKAEHASIDPEERDLIQKIAPRMSVNGIMMFGIDTLVNDDGKRVLSEINASSIGGIMQLKNSEGIPVLNSACNLIWKYISEKIYSHAQHNE